MNTRVQSSVNAHSMCHKLGRFEQQVKERDVVEITVALVMVPVIAFAVALQQVSLLWQVGGWMMVAGLIFIVAYLLHHRLRNRVGATVPSMTAYLSQWKRYYESQIRLLRSVLWWYILPCLSGAVLVVAGVAIVLPKWSVLVFVAGVVFIAMVGGFVLWLNRSYGVRRLTEDLSELERFLASVVREGKDS